MPRKYHWNWVREGRGGVRGLCDMVSVNLSINTLAHINANGTQYV